MPTPPVLFSEGSASDASADVGYWAGLALTAAPGAQLGESAFTDVSPDLVSIETRRGRQHELDRVEAGTGTVVLNSPAGRYDPANALSDLHPNLRPLRRLRLFFHKTGVIYRLFDGPVERYEPEWLTPRNDSEAVTGVQRIALQAVDGFEVLGARDLTTGSYASLQTALTGANNDLVFTAREAGPAGERITVAYVVAGLNTPLSTATNTPLSGNAEVRGKVRGRGRQERNAPPVVIEVSGSDITVNVATDGAGAATSTASQIKTALEANAAAAKLVTVALAPGNTGAGVVTALAKTALAGGSWPAELSGTRIGRALDAIAWPAAARDLDTGVYQVIAGGFSRSDNHSGLQHLQDVADGELGYVFMDGQGTVVFHAGNHRSSDPRSTTSQATYSDDGVGFPYKADDGIKLSLDRDRIFNEVTVTGGAQTAIAQTAVDPGSQLEFETRSLQRSTLLAQDADALTVAETLRTAYANPITRFDEVLMQDRGADGWLPAVLAREIGDRVTVRTNPPGHATTLAYDCFVEAISVRKSPGDPLEVTLQLSPVSVTTGGGGGGGGALLDSSGDDFVLDSGTAGVLG